MARPTKMTPETLKLLREAFAIGCNKKESAAYAKISESTLYDYIKDNQKFSDEIEALIQEPILKAKRTIYDNLNDIKNAQWYLERKKKDEFSQRSEITGRDGEDIKIIIDDYGDKDNSTT